MIAITFIVIGCGKEKKLNDYTICVDVKESKNVKIQSGEFDILRLNDGAEPVLLGNIKDVSFSGGDIIIEASDGLFRHAGDSGKRVATFARKGRSRNEYVSIWSHWVDSCMLHIYDMNGKKILSYNMDGENISNRQISSDAISSPFQLIVPYENGFIGKRVYDGIGEAEELALYNSEYEFIKSIPAFKIKSGIKLHNPFTHFDNIILYNRYFDNIIYEVSEKGVSERYVIDFMEFNIPNLHSYADEYEVIDYLRKGSNNSHASLISNIYESQTYLSFNFLFDGSRYLAIFDKRIGAVESFNFEVDGLSIENILCNQDKIYIFYTNEHYNYMGVTSMSNLLL